MATTPLDYSPVLAMRRQRAERVYREALALPSGPNGQAGPREFAMRALGEQDLYFFVAVILRRGDLMHDWGYERAREVQAEPDGHLDLWSRGTWKSTLITLGLTLQDLAKRKGLAVAIFSYARSAATKFLREIKVQCEQNATLADLWPEIFWRQPEREAVWSEQGGLFFKRDHVRKEPSVSAWGVVDGQPTGYHFDLMVYDDMVTRESVTAEMIPKTTEAWEQSLNLAADQHRERYIGTRWHYLDTYDTMMTRGAVKPRIRPAVNDDGSSPLWSAEIIEDKRVKMGPLTFAAQILMKPSAGGLNVFNADNLRYYDETPESVASGANVYMLSDPANAKKKDSDWTFIWVIACRPDQNFYALELLRDRLSLKERIDAYMRLHRKWRPRAVGIERYGLMADVEALQERQASENYRFPVVELGGQVAKDDRIARLLPIVGEHRLWLRRSQWYTQYDGVPIDLVNYFVEQEFRLFPAIRFKDGLDSLSRICDEDLGIVWPRERARALPERPQGSWMAA